MRSLWTIITVVALANLLAIAGFAGWLAASNRVNMDRIERVRAVFAPTVAQEEADARKAQAEQEALEQQQTEEARIGSMPMTADDRTQTLEELEAIANMRAARAEGETRRLMDALELSWEELKRERAKFEQERKEFLAMRDRLAETEGSEQFRKAVSLYESVGAEAAASMFRELIRQDGPTPGQNTEAVASYLNSMKSRTAAQIIQIFQDADPAMAADLLERVRNYGVNAAAPEGSASNARPNSTANLGSSAPTGG